MNGMFMARSMMRGKMARTAALTGLLCCGLPRVEAAPLQPKHMTPEAVAALDKGLKFLAANQTGQGAWRDSGAYGTYPAAMTGLAGLALLMNGNTTTQGPYAPAVDKAARYVLSRAGRTGLITEIGEESRSMYGHGFSTLFLAELHGMEEDVDRQTEIEQVLARAVDLIARSQSRLGGWLYTPDSNGDEGSVTVTQVQALRACRNAGLAVPKKVIDSAMGYLDKSSRSDGGIAYRADGQGESRPAISAAALVCWYNAGIYDTPRVKKALEYCKDTIPVGYYGGQVAGFYFYAHLYMAQAMYLAGDKEWDEYFPKMRDFLIGRQNADGSWDGDSVGTVYGTAIATIILQLPYNTLPIMQR